ncbi:IclR family transcriptional regulator domain-containing protein [Angustibacter luteus]|uniref:IclR family transcriptional regulator C-terminal domain-containing protein n=1 Tax=Angustibacter luteus TaxID=658456 RepID=A0ABW1JIA7_9ACTN
MTGDAPGDLGSARSTDFVQSLERGLSVIRAFDAEHPALTLSEVARATDLTRAAARRFLLTLVDLGYVRTDGRLFSLRPRVLELGYAFLSSQTLPELAMPHMEVLVSQVHESCSVSVLDGDDVVYVARVPTKRIMTVAIAVGTRFPAYATSMGRVLLAAQPETWLDQYLTGLTMPALTARTVTDVDRLRTVLGRVRSQGYALVDQELEEGLRSLAVPVRDANGVVVAAMNLSAHVSRGSSDAFRRELLGPLREAARGVEQDLGRTSR